MQQSYKEYTINGVKAVLRFNDKGVINAIDYDSEIPEKDREIFRKHALNLNH